MRKTLAGLVAATIGVVAFAPTAATAASANRGSDQTLADVLLADSARDDAEGFDRRWWDYDIVTQAVLLFPDLVDAASNPDAELTVFLPNDAAFRRLVYDISGQWIRNEADVFAAVAGLGTDTVKTVLDYHIVPGAKISYRAALQADGAELTTLQGGTIEVDVKGRWWKYIVLRDADTDDRDPYVRRPNLGGESSNGFAHGINRVLRPVDLP